MVNFLNASNSVNPIEQMGGDEKTAVPIWDRSTSLFLEENNISANACPSAIATGVRLNLSVRSPIA